MVNRYAALWQTRLQNSQREQERERTRPRDTSIYLSNLYISSIDMDECDVFAIGFDENQEHSRREWERKSIRSIKVMATDPAFRHSFVQSKVTSMSFINETIIIILSQFSANYFIKLSDYN